MDGDHSKSVETDYYALLNVSRHATREQIRAAYAHLARALHPDKQNGRAGATEASELFMLVDRAYKVLSSNSQRAVYDSYGEEGLLAYDEVVEADASKAGSSVLLQQVLTEYDVRGLNLRDRILRQLHTRRQLEEVQRFNCRSAVRAEFSAESLLDWLHQRLAGGTEDELEDSDLEAYEERRANGGLSGAELRQAVLEHSVDVPLSKCDTLSLSSYVVARGTRGLGSLGVSCKHDFGEDSEGSCSLTFGSRSSVPTLGLKAERIIGRLAKGSLELTVRDGGERLGLAVQCTQKLDDCTTGVLRWGIGTASGVVVQLHRARPAKGYFEDDLDCEDDEDEESDNEDNVRGAPGGAQQRQRRRRQMVPPPRRRHREASMAGGAYIPAPLNELLLGTAQAQLRLGPGSSGVELSWLRRLTRSARLKLGLMLGTGGAEIEITTSRTLPEHSTANVAVTLGLAGVGLRLRFSRGGVRFVVPVALCSAWAPRTALVAALIPAALQYTVHALLRPYRARARLRRRFERAQRLAEARAAARAQLMLMTRTAERVRAVEEASTGLVIVCARYGDSARLHSACVSWAEDAVLVPPSLSIEDATSADAFDSGDLSGCGDDGSSSDDDDGAYGGAGGAAAACKRALLEWEHFARNVEAVGSVDVTQQLMFFVKDAALDVEACSKARMLGCYDPCAFSQDAAASDAGATAPIETYAAAPARAKTLSMYPVRGLCRRTRGIEVLCSRIEVVC